ncbi:DUF86 domain-containing protein [bacterium]|jgi:uncharacterized protein with HEPN domain|nr:DUF86 domain-containing protein [bacterium]
MKKTPRIYIEHMIECIDIIQSSLSNVSEEDFRGNIILQDSVIRRIQLLWESAKQIPEEIRNLHPEIPWKYMCGMRDKLVHDYLGVNLDIVLEVATELLTPIRSNLESLLYSEE